MFVKLNEKLKERRRIKKFNKELEGMIEQAKVGLLQAKEDLQDFDEGRLDFDTNKQVRQFIESRYMMKIIAVDLINDLQNKIASSNKPDPKQAKAVREI